MTRCLTIQLRKHRLPHAKPHKFNLEEDELIGEFSNLKPALRHYKKTGCTPLRHYLLVCEDGTPPHLIHHE